MVSAHPMLRCCELMEDLVLVCTERKEGKLSVGCCPVMRVSSFIFFLVSPSHVFSVPGRQPVARKSRRRRVIL